MSNPDRTIDKTSLTIDTAEERGLVHRDYLAHCLRWSHIIKFLYQQHRYKDAVILDVGCGKELPLAKSLYSNRMSGATYIGIDVNKLTKPEMLLKAEASGKLDIFLYPQCDFTKLDGLPEEPNIAVSLEVLEHVHPRLCSAMVAKIYEFLAPGGHAFFSTPVYNGSAAANHINEMSYKTTGGLLEWHGFKILDRFGTFASQREYKPLLKKAQALKVYNRLSQYYDSNLLAVMLAPLFPSASRNVLWHVQKPVEPFKDWSHAQFFGETLHIPEHLLEEEVNQHPEIAQLFAV